MVAVDKDGNLTAKKAGSAFVYVVTQDGLFKDTCAVTVTPVLVKGITLRPKEVMLEMGGKETERLWFTFTPSNAANRTYSIVSLDEAVVKISGDLVVAVAKGMAKVVVTSTDGDFTDTCMVTVMAGAGIEGPASSSVKLYPNPASGDDVTLSVPGNAGDAVVSIFDIQGKMIKQQIMNGETATISLREGISNGLYFVKIDSSVGSFIKKLTVR